MFESMILKAVFYVSVSLSFLSVIILSFLIIIRFLKNKKEVYCQERLSFFEKALLVHLQRSLNDAAPILLKTEQDKMLLIDSALKLIQFSKGEVRLRLQSVLGELGLYDWAWQQIEKKRQRTLLTAVRLLILQPKNIEDSRLLALLRHQSVGVRHRVLRLFASTGWVPFFAVFVDYLKSDNTVSVPLIGSMFQQFGTEGANKIIRCIKDESLPSYIREGAVLGLGRVAKTVKDVEKCLLPLCVYQNNELKTLAYEVLAEREISLPIDVLVRGVQENIWQIRHSVAKASIYAQPFPASIIYRLLQDDNFLVALAAQEAVQKVGQKGITLLQTLAKNDEKKTSFRAQQFLAEQMQRMAV